MSHELCRWTTYCTSYEFRRRAFLQAFLPPLDCNDQVGLLGVVDCGLIHTSYFASFRVDRRNADLYLTPKGTGNLNVAVKIVCPCNKALLKIDDIVQTFTFK